MNRKKILIIVGALAFLILTVSAGLYFHFCNILPDEESEFGYYLVDGKQDGELSVSLRNSSDSAAYFAGNGKRIAALNKINNELTYVDPDGRKWLVPVGAVNDGASVPPFLESLVSGGLNTNARMALT